MLNGYVFTQACQVEHEKILFHTIIQHTTFSQAYLSFSDSHTRFFHSGEHTTRFIILRQINLLKTYSDISKQ